MRQLLHNNYPVTFLQIKRHVQKQSENVVNCAGQTREQFRAEML